MKQQPNRYLIVEWRDLLLGFAVEFSYALILTAAAVALAWLVVRLP